MQHFLNRLRTFLEVEVAPLSNALDIDENILKKTYDVFVQLGGLKFLIPKEYSGFGGERSDWIEYNIVMAQYSGALLFLQAQHQFAVSQLKKLSHHSRIADLLRTIAHGPNGFGIALTANRKLLAVEQSKNGFLVSGRLPWVTGFHYFPSLLLSFDVDGITYFSIFPFYSTAKSTSVRISQKIETAVFCSTYTVSVVLKKFFIATDDILATQLEQPAPASEHPAVYNFAGAAKALLNIATQGKYKHFSLAGKTHNSLSLEWDKYYQEILENASSPFLLRARGLALAGKCAHFARAVCGAESVLSSHPMNRIIREIWQYSVAGYSEAQLNAYLEFPSFDLA